MELLEKERKILDLLQERPLSFKDVSEALDISKEDVFEFLDEIREPVYQKTGYLIEVEGKARRISLKREDIPKEIIKLPKITSRTVKILITSDWGWGLTTQQEDLVETAIREAEKEEPEVWFHLMAGNFCAGKPTSKTQKDFFLTSYGEQLDYLIRHFPRASFKHHLINSWRELSWNAPKTIGEALAEKRDDVKCYGNNKASFLVGANTLIILSHLERDYSYYTISHPLQVGIERYQDATEYPFMAEENPDILLLGGINADFEIPPRLPLKKERKNNFYGQALPSLCMATDTQLSRQGRKAIPFVLGYIILILDFDDKGFLKCEPKFDVRYLPYQKKNSYLGQVSLPKDLTDEQKKIVETLNKRSGLSRGDTSRVLHKSIPHGLGVIDQLQKKGYQIIWSEAEKRYKLVKPLKEKFEPVSIEIASSAKTAAFSDTHLGHENERPDLIKKVYQLAEQRKVDRILFCGDLFEGKDAYSQQEWELKYHLADQQLDHALEIWPKSKIWTDIIRGSVGHETAFLRKGYDMVRNFCRLASAQYKKRVNYLGGMNAISKVEGIPFQLFHPKGSIPIGISYRLQNLVREMITLLEKYSRGKLMFSGHLHVAAAMHWKGVSIRQVPSLQETTDYLESGGHIAWLGMWACEDFVDKYGNVIRTIREYIPLEPKLRKSGKKKK